MPDSSLRLALAGAAAVVIGSLLTLQIAHVGDKFQVNDNAAIWMTLAKEAGDGRLYRPLFDGKFYGGTRYMPVPIFSYAAAAKATGHLLVPGKLLAYAYAFALFGLAFYVLRRLGCSRLAALALICGIIVTPTGLLAATSLHFDTPSPLFQLAALAIVTRSERRTSTVAAAGVLCGLALMSKLNALWAPAAIGIWLLARNRRVLPVFAGAVAATAGILFGVVELASRGRFTSNIFTLAFAGYHGSLGESDAGSSLHAGAERLIDYSRHDAKAVLLLLPLAALAVAIAIGRRSLTLYQLALLIEIPLLFSLYRDQGADYNHLIDASVLVVVVVGGMWGASRSNSGEFSWPRAVIAAVLIWGLIPAYRDTMFGETRGALKKLVGRGNSAYRTHPLAGYVSNQEEILSEDPYIPVSVGERPVVLDQFMYLRLAKTRPAWVEALARRVRAREFRKIVLDTPIEQSPRYGHFGGAANAAISTDYVLMRQVGPYWLYIPKSPT